MSCLGCGALTQTVTSDEAGYYTRTRQSIKAYLRALRQNTEIERLTQVADLTDIAEPKEVAVTI